MTNATKNEARVAVDRENALLARYRRARVLVIEDSAEARGMLRGFMRDSGVEKIDLASSGQEGLEYMKSHRYDIVLCDYNLGKGKDGQQVLEEARYGKFLSYNTVFMMVTAETTLEMVMGALEYQPDNYLSKPFTRKDLTSRLNRALEVKMEFRDIEAAFENEDYPETLRLCDKKIATAKTLPYRALRLKGEALLTLKRYAEAISLFKKVLQDRELAWAKIGLGRALYLTDVPEEAALIFEELIKAQPNVVESYDWLAKIQIKQGQPRVAQDTLEAAVNRSPKAVLRQLELARVATRNHSYLVAEKAYRKVIVQASESCYHAPEHYLQYVRALLVKIDGEGSILERDAFKEAQLFLSRLRKEFPSQPAVDFRANLLDALVNFRHGNKDASDSLIRRAEAILEKFAVVQRLIFAEEFIGTLSLVERFDEAEAFVHELQKISDKPELANRLRQRIQEGKARQVSEALNREALSLYERGQILEAQTKFRKAAESFGVGSNLLLNACRTCLDLAEREDLNQSEWRAEAGLYLERLKDLDSRDHRYEVFSQLLDRHAAL